MANERVETSAGDTAWQQAAAAQAARSMFVAGKAVSRTLDANWERDYRIPVGTAAIDGGVTGMIAMDYTRVIKVGRNVVCDTTLVSKPADPSITTQLNNGTRERGSGFNSVGI